MVNKKQFIDGVLKYIDNEIIPELPTSGKWGMGTMIVLASNKYEDIYDELVSNELVKMLNIVDENNMIDIDCLADALKKSAEKYGKLQITLPVIGTMIFSSDDVDKVQRYIKGGAAR